MCGALRVKRCALEISAKREHPGPCQHRIHPTMTYATHRREAAAFFGSMGTLRSRRKLRALNSFASIILLGSFAVVTSVKFKRPHSVLESEVLSDLDECAYNLHDCSPVAVCIPHSGAGYSCKCNAGWVGNGRKCVNENECELGGSPLCGSNSVCSDTIGSFMCTCASGFELDGDFCVDIDECSRSTHGCLPGADCTNTHGSFSCACPSGFNGDGATVCTDMCANAAPIQRIDCFQQGNATQGLCEARGCCWSPDGAGAAVPVCHYPLPANSYELYGTKSSRGLEGKLECSGKMRFGSEICPLQLSVKFETADRLRVRIFDPNTPRWEVPPSLYPDEAPQPQSDEQQYKVSYTTAPFGFAVTRVATSEVLFNSTPVDGRSSGLIFEEQFLSITAQVEDDPILYGLGEHVAPLRLPVGATKWTPSSSSRSSHKHNARRSRHERKPERKQAEALSEYEEAAGGEDLVQAYTLFAKDRGGVPEHTASGGSGLYGSHPFLMQLTRKHALAHGILLLNSNAMDVLLSRDTISYRAIGGVLDMYFFLGPTPADVVRQYTDLVGKPLLPPYWGLGFQLCRWGYGSVGKTREVVEAMRAAGMPQDVQWNDIDYMRGKMDFTLDPAAFAAAEMQALVADLHAHGQRYTMIIDPGIPSTPAPGEYAPLDDGNSMGVFVKNAAGAALTGKVWPGLVHFPDFLHPRALEYWEAQLTRFHQLLAFDGVWLDMNEPSNFCDGECTACSHDHDHGDGDGEKGQCENPETERQRLVYAPWKLRRRGGARLNPKSAPYLPGGERLEEKTVSMDAQHTVCSDDGACAKVLHYDAHNLYALAEGRVTAAAARRVRGERTQIISRGTFPGSGRVVGHWLGDNKSEWAHLRQSVAGMLTMGLLGVPLVGADICGFAGDTTRELCVRWMQLGSLYPFSRNHNTIGAKPQEPSAWDDQAQAYMRKALQNRYKLLPYLYTCFYHAQRSGVPVARALMMEAEGGERLEVADVDWQFMIGPALLVTPVLDEGATTVTGTFFTARWFELESGAPLRPEASQGKVPGQVVLAAGLDTLPVHVRGGHVVAMQRSAMTSAEGRRTPVTLLAAADAGGRAGGELFMDDGVTEGTVESGAYTLVRMAMTAESDGARGNVSCDVAVDGYDPAVDMGQPVVVEVVRVLGADGLKGRTVHARVNGEAVDAAGVEYSDETGELRLDLAKASLRRQPSQEGWGGHRGDHTAAEMLVDAEVGLNSEDGKVWLPSVKSLVVDWWSEA